MGTSAEDVIPGHSQPTCPSVCPLCGGAVRLAQCGWMRAMPICQNAQCLYPMVSDLPTPCLARSYTDMPASPCAASPTKEADAVVEDGHHREVTESAIRQLPVEPEEVFVHWLTGPTRATAAAAAALTAVLCGTVQRAGVSAPTSPLAACSRAYAKALRLARASLQPTVQASAARPVGGCGADARRHFRNLAMDADMERLVLRELESIERTVAKPLTLSATDSRDDFYDTLHRLIKSDRHLARRFQTVFTLRQVCTVCFKQHVSRQKATVLRLNDPAPDFDLYDPAKRVFLRPCHYCRAPQQRVLLRWERSSDGRSPVADAVFLEARDGLTGVTQLKSLRADGVTLLPTAALQRVAGPDNHFYYIVWLYGRDSGRWMRLGPAPGGGDSGPLACHDVTAAPAWLPGELAAALFERDGPREALSGSGGGTEPSSSFTCESGPSSAVALAPPPLSADPPAAGVAVAAFTAATDDEDILAQLLNDVADPPPPPQAQPFVVPAASALRAGSRRRLHSRLEAVMAQRRPCSSASSSLSASASAAAASVHSDPIGGVAFASSASSSLLPPGADAGAASASGRGFVLSRFLSTAQQVERRLPAYNEDRHLLEGRRRRADDPDDSAQATEAVAVEPQLKRVCTADQISLVELAKSNH